MAMPGMTLASEPEMGIRGRLALMVAVTVHDMRRHELVDNPRDDLNSQKASYET